MQSIKQSEAHYLARVQVDARAALVDVGDAVRLGQAPVLLGVVEPALLSRSRFSASFCSTLARFATLLLLLSITGDRWLGLCRSSRLGFLLLLVFIAAVTVLLLLLLFIFVFLQGYGLLDGELLLALAQLGDGLAVLLLVFALLLVLLLVEMPRDVLKPAAV